MPIVVPSTKYKGVGQVMNSANAVSPTPHTIATVLLLRGNGLPWRKAIQETHTIATVLLLRGNGLPWRKAIPHTYPVLFNIRLCASCLLYTSDAADDLLCVD